MNLSNNRALMCVGAIAGKPYYVEKAFVNVYSIEELCYVIYENAFMIDRDIVNRELAEWIDVECKLHDLARELFSLINQNAMASSFVGTIMLYAGYYSKAEIEKVESILRMNVTMNVYEKWKSKADFLYESRHYLLAQKEYQHVLDTLPEDDYELRSKVYNNMGVTYMALYLYDAAIECFEKAYECDNSEVAYKHYLKAMRLKLSEDEYLRFLSSEEDAYIKGVPLEGELERIRQEFDESDAALKMKELFEMKHERDAQTYYEEIGRMTETLKNDYRDIVLETEKM